MGKLILYGFDPSIPVRPVKLTLAALQLPYEFVEVNVFSQQQMSEEYLKKNPQHTIPMLEDDGACIWDSHAIMCYLVSKYGKDDSLYPKDLLKRAIVNQRLYFESGVVFADAIRRTNMMAFCGTPVTKDRIDAIVEVYNLMEAFLKDHDYIAGDTLTIADFSLISPISSLVGYVKIDAAKFAKLTAWVKRMEKLPYYSENAVGAEIFLTALKNTNFTIEE
ncbi:glutathione S-transferase 1-like [Drosophila sulfurigaster albostrigata]|uniref:glutathione S-transferase 1-like n=1 Tax=Drosophila sulfurigaster albostrigata TaxID=89887 RepID=UPI002D21CDE0|nr:glutathione S-transferase 1-like [Drosophila sulfurigaster albostrigata]